MNMNCIRRTTGRPRRKGQALVEFSLVLPLILTIFAGVTELGFILNDYMALVSANAEAARYGTSLVGYNDANELIVQRLLEARGHLQEDGLQIIGGEGSELGTFKRNADGSLQTADGGAPSLGTKVFFMYDNGTPTDFSDDVPMSSGNVNVSYVRVRSNYNHQIVVPLANMLGNEGVFPLGVDSTFPCTFMSISTSDPNVGALGGAAPITVMDQPFVVGQPYVLKGKSDEDPDRSGNFGWVNLDQEVGGNKNEKIAGWLNGKDSPPVVIPGPLPGFTGQRNAAVIKEALDKLGNSYLVILIHDSHTGTGNNLMYNEVGMAVFLLEGFKEQDSGGNAFLTVEGRFVRRF